jgi:cytochrome c-type biogenesis protein CcmF
VATIQDVHSKLRNAHTVMRGLQRLTPSYYGMLIAHMGFAVAVIGAGLTSAYTQERDLRMAVGEHVEFAGYDFLFSGTEPVRGPNYIAERGLISVSRNDKFIAELHPEKRRYNARRDQMMTEASIDAGVFRDIYVALGEPLEKGAWAVRLHLKPFVRWIWFGGFLMGAGGALAAADKRYRLRRNASNLVPAPVREGSY